ncbi:hypothetical protein BH09PSE5_BH09PSE5_08420 [soil metagenome]
MKERGILMSAPMVRALLAGSKTQTRRIIKDQSIGEHFCEMRPEGAYLEWLGTPSCGTGVWDVPEFSGIAKVPYGVPGDRLWIKEDVKAAKDENGYITHHVYSVDGARVPRLSALAEWASDGMAFAHHVDASRVRARNMPRWASRITLEITDVRVERLQDISEADAIAEGIEPMPCAVPDTRLWKNYTPGNGWTPSLAIPRNSYATLWDSINGPDSWSGNPWVWCVSFRVLANQAAKETR